jgi:hypothetical protein
MALKHLYGFMTLYFFVVLTSDDETITSKNRLYVTLVLYAVFALTTKTSFVFTLIIMAAIYGLYANSISQKEYKKKKDQESYDRLEKINTILQYIFMIALVLGVILYYGEKRLEYGGKNWSWYTYLFGRPQCKFDRLRLFRLDDYWRFFKAAFGFK